jgi:hypothetical protein
MSKEARDAIISVRISEEQQAQLKALAAARGTSVSDLVRSVVVREVSEPMRRSTGRTQATTGPAPVEGTTTSGALTQAPGVDQGVFWDDGFQSGISGATITVRS